MPARRRLAEPVQRHVHERANGLCEYCHTIEKWQYVRFTIDHIVSLAQGGTDDIENLALACFHCNRRKSNLALGTDPESGLACALFHPRQMIWSAHFIWSADCTELIGLTPTGRATIAQLDLNRLRIRNIRSADVAVNRHPPHTDPVLKST